ncbi:MAG: mechanosensitive ion channel family protein [Flavobacterium sp.]|nr:MAG: mechanosensitive ion channel family protein [Flavobacterium sp.]
MDLGKFYTRAYDWMIVFGPRLILGLIVLFVGFWLVRLVTKWIGGRMQKRNVDATAKPFLISLLGVVLRILLILAVMQILGMEMTLFTALVGAFGVAAGLALSGTLQNFASGIIILLVKPFSVGDNIITQGLEGTVTSIRIFHTLVTTFDNRSVIVPNSKLSNEVIINISRKGTRRLDIEIKFTNAIDISTVKKIISGAIDKCSNILSSPERRIGVVSIENDGYKLGVNVWVNAHGFQDTKLALQEAIVEDLKKAELKLPGM